MKYLPQDQNIKTSCKNCVHAIYNLNTQVSCSFSRIESFGDSVVAAYDDEKEFYVINRFCNYYRDKSWGYSSKDKQKTECESAISFDVVFDCSDLSKEKSDKIVTCINNNKYYDNKINFILLQKKINDRYDDINKEIMRIYPKISKKIVISVCEDISLFMHQLVLKTKSLYHVFIDNNSNLDNSVFDIANDYVNTSLKKFLVAKIRQNKIIRNLAYKSFYDLGGGIDYFQNVESICGCCNNTQTYIEI